MKLQWLEILGNSNDWRNSEDPLRKLPAALIVDAKGLYDEFQTAVYIFRGKEKRTDVEAMTLKEGIMTANTWALWVHGGAPLANSLKEGHEPGKLRLCHSGGVLRHVSSDPPGEMMHISAGAASRPIGSPEYEATS